MRTLQRFRSPLLALLALVAVAAIAWSARPTQQPVAAAETPAASTVAIVPAPVAPQVVTPAPAAAVRETDPVAVAVARAPAAAQSGMRAYLDPETGMIGGMPPSTEDEGSAMLLNDSDEGLVPVVMPDGSIMLDLQGRFQEFFVLDIDKDGRRVLRCVQNPARLERLSDVSTQTLEDR